MSSVVDWARTACLCQSGMPGYVAAVAVAEDGTESLWLVDEPQLSRPDAPCGDPCQRHEQVGRLPRGFRDRIWGDALRCGAATYAGAPCRIRVAEPGDRCGHHAGVAS